jgi:hypothetical protein
MSRIKQLTHDEWIPMSLESAAVIDRLPEELSAQFGWVWETVEEDGLGPVSYCPLAWDGVPRFLLSSSGFYPQDGINVEVAEQDGLADARADFLAELGLTPDVFLVVREGDCWFARWDPPHTAGVRPATARPR